MELNAIRQEYASQPTALQHARSVWSATIDVPGPPGGLHSEYWEDLRVEIKQAEKTGSFVFSHRYLDGMASVQLTQYLRNDCRAHFVDISFLGGWKECSLATAAAIQHGLRATRFLTLDGNDIGSSHSVLDAWCLAFKVHPGLRSLSLKETGIDDEGAKYLADALHGHAALFSLDLGRNRISDAGVLTIADAVSKSHVIVEVNVQGTDSSSLSRSRLNYMLERNRSSLPDGVRADDILSGLQRARSGAFIGVHAHLLPALTPEPSELVNS